MAEQTFSNELVDNTIDLCQLQRDAMDGIIAAAVALTESDSSPQDKSAKEIAFEKLLERMSITLPFPLPSPPQISVQEMVDSLLGRKGKPPRMPNEFFIYRKALVKELKVQGHKIKMTDMSQLASRSWKEEPRKTKGEYRKIAREIERLYTRTRSEQIAQESKEAEATEVVVPLTPDSDITSYPLTENIFGISIDSEMFPLFPQDDTITQIPFPTPNSVAFSPSCSQLDFPSLFLPLPLDPLGYGNPIDNNIFLEYSQASPATPTSSESDIELYLNLPNQYTHQYSPISSYASSTHPSPTVPSLDYEAAEYIDFQLLQ